MTRDEQALVLKTVELGVEVAELRSAVKLLTNERDYLRTALAESLKPQLAETCYGMADVMLKAREKP